MYTPLATTFTALFACDFVQKSTFFLQIQFSVGSKQRATTTLDFEHVFSLLSVFSLFVRTAQFNPVCSCIFCVCHIFELSPFNEKEFETLTIELTQKNKKILLCNIYRSPTLSLGQSSTVQIENFTNKLDELLQNIYQRSSNAYVFLDANINLLKLSNSKSAQDYLEMTHSNGFLQLISKATQISGDS